MALSVNFNFWVFFRLPFLLSFQWCTCFNTVFAISFYIIFLNGPSFRILCNLAPRFCRCPMMHILFTVIWVLLHNLQIRFDVPITKILSISWFILINGPFKTSNNSFRFQWSSRTFMVHWTFAFVGGLGFSIGLCSFSAFPRWALCTFLIITHLYHLYQNLLL